jgi:hypothetical protein
MTKTTLLSTILVATLISLLRTVPAQATANFISFIASTGSDANPCTRAAPCTSVQRAAQQTVFGGTISCIDNGLFTGGQITQSVTLDCLGTGGTIIAGGSTVISINGAGIVVTLRNIAINGLGTGPDSLGSTGQIGVNFINGSALHIENVKIYGNNTSPAVGIKFSPLVSSSQLIVTDTVITNNGSGSSGGGIVISPQSSGSARVSLQRVTVAHNAFGIAADGTGSTGGINMTIKDSDIAGNTQDGIVATTPSGGAPIGVMVTNSKSVNNAFGVRSLGTNVTVRVKNSDVTGNGTGLSFGGGGALLTYGNNAVNANGADGAFSGSIGLQ